MTSHFAIVNNSTKIVENVVLAENPQDVSHPEGTIVIASGFATVFIGGTYDETTDSFSPPPEPEISIAEQKRRKQAAYVAESDPLFFKWQAGEIDKEEWLASRAAIKKRFEGNG